jgi:hypothetical protein
MSRVFHRLAASTGASRSRVLLVAMLLYLPVVLGTVIWGGVQHVPLWATSWQGAHGHYPTGHLTYTVPNGWDTTTLTGLSIKNPGVWWDVFDDQVSATSPTYAACFTPPCAAGSDLGAIVYLQSAPGQASPPLRHGTRPGRMPLLAALGHTWPCPSPTSHAWPWAARRRCARPTRRVASCSRHTRPQPAL